MYMVLYKGTYDIFFGIEHRPRMEVCCSRSNIHSPTRMQAVMIASTRRVEFQWRLVMDGILVDTERKKEPSRLFLGHEGRFAQSWVFVR